MPSADFVHGLETFGEALALLCEDGERISYAELARRADAFAARLGDARRLIAIEADNSADAITAYLGALRGGHAVMLVAPDAGGRTEQILDTYAPDAVFARRDGAYGLELGQPRGGLHPELALLLSTSGTTGAVKLVRLSLAAVSANAESIRTYLDIRADDRAITSLPIHYSYGLSVLNSHLASGAALLVTDRSVMEPEFWEFFEREGGTSCAGVPHSYGLMERSGVRSMALPTLRTMTQAGGRMPPELVATFGKWAEARGVRFFVMYGQTEATARMAYMPPERLLDHPDCIGIAIPGGRFELRDADGAPIDGAGRTGELVYSGPNVMMGYALARADLAGEAEVEALATGDLAERTGDGLFRIVGRKSRFCKPFGLRVGLDEIEALLGREGISAMATGTDDLIAVACREGPPAAQVAARLASALELPASLFEIVEVAEFPTLPSGKPDYQSLLRTAQERHARAAEAGQDAGFAQLYGAILNRRGVAPGDSFTTLEGDSLSYITASTAIEDRLGHVPDGWEAMTVAELDRLAATASPAARRGILQPLQSEVLLRALAILTVVLTHAKSELNVGGGADVLMILAGFSFARFDFARASSSGAWPVVRRFLLNVVLPYYAILMIYTLFRKVPDWESFLLIGNFKGVFSRLIAVYWFIEALFQMLILVALAFSIPMVRRWAKGDAFLFASGFFVVTMLLKLVAFQLFHHDALMNRTPDCTLPYFALGLAIYFARGWRERLACMAFLAALVLATSGLFGISGWFGGWSFAIGVARGTWTALAGIALVFLPRVWLPGPARRVVTAIAAISFTIYLVHALPIHFVVEQAHASPWLGFVVALAFSFLVAGTVRLLRRSRIWPLVRAREAVAG